MHMTSSSNSYDFVMKQHAFVKEIVWSVTVELISGTGTHGCVPDATVSGTQTLVWAMDSSVCKTEPLICETKKLISGAGKADSATGTSVPDFSQRAAVRAHLAAY